MLRRRHDPATRNPTPQHPATRRPCALQLKDAQDVRQWAFDVIASTPDKHCESLPSVGRLASPFHFTEQLANLGPNEVFRWDVSHR